jgi:hypothetical protein
MPPSSTATPYAPANRWAARPRSGPPSARQRARTATAPCLPSSPLNASQCTAAGFLRQGQALRGAPAGYAWDSRVGGPLTPRQMVLVAGSAGRWRASHHSGYHPRHARGALRSRAGRPPRSDRQRGREDVSGMPRCWRTAVAGAVRAGRGAGVNWWAAWWQCAPTPLTGRYAPWLYERSFTVGLCAAGHQGRVVYSLA